MQHAIVRTHACSQALNNRSQTQVNHRTHAHYYEYYYIHEQLIGLFDIHLTYKLYDVQFLLLLGTDERIQELQMIIISKTYYVLCSSEN